MISFNKLCLNIESLSSLSLSLNTYCIFLYKKKTAYIMVYIEALIFLSTYYSFFYVQLLSYTLFIIEL
ncbi:uncharacterized protein BX663DRAFT_514224 [Cokeromyces recurvatus]|uniref:uncharacterized protein n=1 Tax=Cokeromyces recurvatus TaxID=90255 RepID=UPI00221E7A2A|nr:uncharacterized protein BX663DRAFT_514224 [Cokeromyces recurvatus]KAI7901365.1 hypothetical protein BX663DRAFT_514224 [Cokeromyces recurvatus]